MPIYARSRAVFDRDEFGRFAAECEAAAARTAAQMAKEGARIARTLAPAGKKVDTRAGHTKLKASISWRMTGKTRAEWVSKSKHALPQETGSSSHAISGFLHFWWDKAGRMFVWNDPHYNNWTEAGGVTIHHPGNRAQPYMAPSYKAVSGRMISIAKDNYPG